MAKSPRASDTPPWVCRLLPAAIAVVVLAGGRSARAQEVRPPRLLSPPAAVLPEGAPARAADVIVVVAVDENGSVTSVEIARGATPALEEAARESARALRFEPARRGDATVPARVRLRIRLRPPRVDRRQVSADRPPATGERYETVVTATPREARRQLRREEVTRTPGTMGDPFRVIETLPGVVPILTGVPYYYIRGAPPADTGNFIDGIRVPALFHLALGPSVIHPSLVERVDFWAGGAPARFPGFVGGVVGAGTAPIPADRPRLDVDVRLVDAGAIASAPLDDGALRVSVSGRYSYTAALLSALQEDVFLDYWDYQLRIERDVGPRQTATVFAFGSFDQTGEVETDGARQTQFAQVFHRLDGRSRWLLSGARSLEVATAVGSEQTLLGDDGALQAREVSVGPRVEYRAVLDRDLSLRLGGDALYAYSSFTTNDDEDGLSELLPTRDLVSTGLYGELAYRASSRATLLPAFRLFAVHAAGTVHPAVDPRLGARVELGDGIALKAGIGLYHQPPAFVIPLPGLGSLDFDRGLQRAVQASQGVEWRTGWGLDVDAQIFIHRYENISDVSIEEIDDQEFPRMSGNAYGLEVVVRRPLTARLFGWIAYTLSRSERRFDGLENRRLSCQDPSRVELPPLVAASDLDRTHVLNVVASYELPGGFRAGARLHYRSGRPFTRRLCFVDDFGDEDVSGPKNGERMPGFLRLDLRIDKRWRYRGWDLELYFEFLNVTFAEEVIEMEQEWDVGDVGGGSYGDAIRYGEPYPSEDSFPIVIPTLGVRGAF